MRNKNSIFLILTLIFGAFIRFWGIDWGLPHEYQSEEYKVVKYAVKMGSGDLNPHFFEYPSLYLYFMLFQYGVFYLLGRVVGLFGSTHDFAIYFVKDPTAFYLLGRLSEALFGILIIYLVYLLGKKLFSEKVGLLSAILFSALPHFIYMSHIIKGYMGMTVLLLLFFFCTLKITEDGKLKWYLLSSLFLGLAISTRYHAAPFGIALPLAHIYRNYLNIETKVVDFKLWPQNKNILLSLLLIPAFFFIGTPYAILAPGEFWKDVGGNLDIYSELTGEETVSSHGLFTTIRHFLYFGDVPAPLFLGIVVMAGFVYSLYRWKLSHLLLIVPIFTYIVIVSGYHHSAGGYLLQVFPLFVVLGIYGILSIEKKPWKWISLAFLGFGLAWNALEGAKMAYSFTVEDTRTTAKNWIEKNIPPGSAILIDNKVLSPPILMAYIQLEKFQKKAVKLNHYKKEYLTLQLEAHPGKGKGYRIYTVQRNFRQIASLEHQVEEVQKMEDLVKVSSNISNLKKTGIQYVIVNDFSKDGAIQANLKGISDFYKNLPSHSKEIKIFPPQYKISHSGTIRIFKL